MLLDILQLLQDYGVRAMTEGHKHCRPGWVNMECPFCTGNPGMHLGASLDGNTFYCWRCGWHSPSSAISKLINIPEKDAKVLLKQYVGLSAPVKEIKRKLHTKSHKHPSNTRPLENRHKRYLEKRGFDVDYLEKEWRLLGTGPTSILRGDDNKQIDYSNRILAPFIWDGEEVTYQCRSINNEHPLRYLACPEERELIKHKHILYGRQDKWKDTGICVEGITDVWRFGPIAFATCGIKYTYSQIRVISKTFKRVPVIFDDDPQAIIQANLLVSELQFRGIDSFRVPIVGDPGAMSQEEADYLVKQLIR